MALHRRLPQTALYVGRCLPVAAAIVLVLIGTAGAQEFRTWTDSTGKYEIKAKLVEFKSNVVTLEQQDGQRVEIPLDKLSLEDRAVVLAAGDNPFKSVDSPFKSVDSAKPTAAAGPRTIEVDWSVATPVSLIPPSETWDVAAASVPAELAFSARNVALPAKTNFFEGMKGLVVNAVARKAVVGYNLGEPKPDGTTRVVICDLETGRSVAAASASGLLAPLALHDNGQHVVMRRDEFGFGKQDRLEVWSVEGQQITKVLVFTPYDDVQGGGRDVMWAEFLDEQHLATSSRSGKVAIWKFPAAEPLCYFQLSDGAVPALSPDRKTIAFCNSKEMGLFDVASQQVIAMTATPRDLQWPYMAFSPSGQRLGCIAFDQVLVWDLASGQLQCHMPCPGIHIHGAIAFAAESFILGGNRFLIDVDNQLKLWQYDGAEQVATVAGTSLIGVTNGDRPGALLATELPHREAAQLLTKALKEPDLFVFHQGTTVNIDVSAIDASYRDQVQSALITRLTEMGCQVGPRGTIDLVASVEGPKQREISYINSGDYKVQEYTTRLKFVYQGQPVWETSSSSVPGFIMLKQGENIEGVLRASEKPNYSFYERVEIPKFLQKPAAGQGPNSRQTIGGSQVTASGIK